MYKKEKLTLLKYYNNENKYEIAVDECGRGPLFGRTYIASVILPNNDTTFNYSILKDSKKFSSKKKIKEVAEYVKKNAIAYSIQYVDENEIDRINILQAVLKGMKLCITDIINKINLEPENYKNTLLLVDGNQFKPFIMFDKIKEELIEIPHIKIEHGDNLYCSIAAASIIAKVEHDEYILDLCSKYPLLVDRYNLDKNVGYGTTAHLDGIREFGICQFHRKTFGICKNAEYNPI